MIQEHPRRRTDKVVLLLSVFVVASCGIAYQLVIGTTGAYISGDGVTQFSLTIGVYLFAMGLGSFLSRRITKNLLSTFITVELMVGLVGGFANAILIWVYGFVSAYEVAFYGVLVVVGVLIGLEIPLLLRLLVRYGSLRINLANVLGLDYVGALLVALAFPLLLLPRLGLMRTSLAFGMINVAVAGVNVIFFRKQQLSRALPVGVIASLLALAVAFAYSSQLVGLTESRQYDDKIILTRQTASSRLVLSRWQDEMRLSLDHGIRFSSRDEHRYHEALVHPAVSALTKRDRILMLGGGHGLGLREVLKYPDVKEVVLIAPDREMVKLCRTNVHIRKMNNNALSSKKVRIVYRDVWSWLQDSHRRFNAILVDVPPPADRKLAKLYSLEFYRLCRRNLADGGALVVQSTSPFFTPGAFWGIHATLRAVELHVTPIRIHVPSMGMWGFNLASAKPRPWHQRSPNAKSRYLKPALWQSLFKWPRNQRPLDVEISTLAEPRIVRQYRSGFRSSFPDHARDSARRPRR